MDTTIAHTIEYVKHVVLTGLFVAGTFGLFITVIGLILRGGRR